MSGRASRLPVVHLEDRLLLAEGTAWAWFRLPTTSYEFLSDGEREGLLATTALALAGLAGSELHLAVVPDAYATSAWREHLERGTGRPARGWSPYLDVVESHLHDAAFWQRRVYLGVQLGRRGPGRGLGRRSRQATGRVGASPREAASWQAKAEPIERALSSSGLRAAPASVDDLRWLVQRAFWRGMQTPTPPTARAGTWRGGSVEALAESTLRNGLQHLVLEQPGDTAHVAFLAAARFPDVMQHPGSEWLYRCDTLGFPVEASVRFRLVPPRQASADAARKVAEVTDQARHISGTSAEVPMALVEAADRARELEYALAKEGLPLVYAWPRFAVAASGAAELDARAGYLIESYRDIGIDLVRPSGDQLSLFFETLPGDRVRVKSYEQRQALVTLAGGMFTATTDLGDRAGPYIGETSGRTRSPVHFDPLAAAQRNLPTAIAVTGQPGAGKTNLAELLLYQQSLRGAWGLMIDPKNEAGRLASLPGLGDAQVLELTTMRSGVLDPFAIGADPARGALLAADVLRLLLPAGLSAAQESPLLAACHDEAESEAPCLAGVRARLAAADASDEARQLAQTIRSVASLPLARLFFAPAGGPLVSPADRLTILQMEGLVIPEAGTRPEEYTLADRLAVAVMYLVTVFASELADAARAQAKIVVLDEAWALTASRQGRALVQRLARTGRSKNTALVLVSQNASDFLGPEVQNNFSAKFAFRSTQDDEVLAVCRLLGVEPTAQHRRAVRTLGNGECVFADLDGRVGTTRIDLVLPELAAAFDTTPRPAAPLTPAGLS